MQNFEVNQLALKATIAEMKTLKKGSEERKDVSSTLQAIQTYQSKNTDALLICAKIHQDFISELHSIKNTVQSRPKSGKQI